jgi:hypothetical protein
MAAHYLQKWQHPTTEELRDVEVDKNTIFCTPPRRPKPLPCIAPGDFEPVVEEPALTSDRAREFLDIFAEQLHNSQIEFKRSISLYFYSPFREAREQLEAFRQLERALDHLLLVWNPLDEHLELVEQLDRDLGPALQEADRITRSLISGSSSRTGYFDRARRNVRKFIVKTEFGPRMLNLVYTMREFERAVDDMIQTQRKIGSFTG